MKPLCNICDREGPNQIYQGPCQRPNIYADEGKLGDCPGYVSWKGTAEKYKAMWAYSEQRLDLFMEKAKPLYDLLLPYYSYPDEEVS